MAVDPSVSVALAQITARSAMLPLVIHILVPSSCQPSAVRVALVRMAAGSEPASGSVSPKQPIRSPAAMPGSHLSFCSSEPYRWIGYIASDPWTETSDRMPESPASSSRQARP